MRVFGTAGVGGFFFRHTRLTMPGLVILLQKKKDANDFLAELLLRKVNSRQTADISLDVNNVPPRDYSACLL